MRSKKFCKSMNLICCLGLVLFFYQDQTLRRVRIENVNSMLADYLITHSQKEVFLLSELLNEFPGISEDKIRDVFKNLIRQDKIPEYFEIIDKDTGKLTGVFKLREAVHRDGDWHRMADLIIIDTSGKMLIQLRGQTEMSSGKWDVSVGCHVSAGEGFKEAILNEIFEEIGLKVNANEIFTLVKAGSLRKSGKPDTEEEAVYEGDGYYLFKYQTLKQNREFGALYLYVVTDKKRQLIKPGGEVAEIKFVDIEEERERILAHPEQYAGSLRFYLGYQPLFEEITTKIKTFLEER